MIQHIYRTTTTATATINVLAVHRTNSIAAIHSTGIHIRIYVQYQILIVPHKIGIRIPITIKRSNLLRRLLLQLPEYKSCKSNQIIK